MAEYLARKKRPQLLERLLGRLLLDVLEREENDGVRPCSARYFSPAAQIFLSWKSEASSS